MALVAIKFGNIARPFNSVRAFAPTYSASAVTLAIRNVVRNTPTISAHGLVAPSCFVDTDARMSAERATRIFAENSALAFVHMASSVPRNVSSLASHAVSLAHGGASIRSARRCAMSFAIDHLAMSLASVRSSVGTSAGVFAASLALDALSHHVTNQVTSAL